MSNYLLWLVLTAVTGSPLLSAFILLVAWFFTDRFTLGVLPDPFRFISRWQRARKLEHDLLVNPHDGRARLELAGLYVERGANQRAVEVLKPNLEKGDDDVQTVFTMGAACVGAGFTAQGEQLLAHAAELSPDFRVGEIDLVLGRARLARGDFAGAKQALTRLLAVRRGSVEGRVLLGQALVKLGDDGAAALLRDEAWHEHVSSPSFQRRKQRLWAWRARPSRPLAYLAVLVLALGLFGRFVAPQLAALSHGSRYGAQQAPEDEE
jgi:hypothetical protein